jgi:hypothetical protein
MKNLLEYCLEITLRSRGEMTIREIPTERSLCEIGDLEVPPVKPLVQAAEEKKMILRRLLGVALLRQKRRVGGCNAAQRAF